VNYVKPIHYTTHLRPGLKKIILSEESPQISFNLWINFSTVPEQFQADNIKNLAITLNITAANNRIQMTINVLSKALTLFPKTAKVATQLLYQPLHIYQIFIKSKH